MKNVATVATKKTMRLIFKFGTHQSFRHRSTEIIRLKQQKFITKHNHIL
jgi:hypothetical protein